MGRPATQVTLAFASQDDHISGEHVCMTFTYLIQYRLVYRPSAMLSLLIELAIHHGIVI